MPFVSGSSWGTNRFGHFIDLYFVETVGYEGLPLFL